MPSRSTILRLSGDAATRQNFVTEIATLAASMRLKLEADDSPSATLTPERPLFRVVGNEGTRRVFVEEARALAVSLRLVLDHDEGDSGIYEDECIARDEIKRQRLAAIDRKKAEAWERRCQNLDAGRNRVAAHERVTSPEVATGNDHKTVSEWAADRHSL